MAAQETVEHKYVYDFAEGNKDLKDLLGGKGANLAEMTNLGLPVPPGFTITTEACKAYLGTGTEPAGLADQITAHLTALEREMGRRLGDPDDPLLVSVRSGAKFSMPGMMETVLNVGLNDRSVEGLARQAGGSTGQPASGGADRFAWDSYRRLIQMFGKTVCDVPGEEFEHALDEAKRAKGTDLDLDLDADDLRGLVDAYKKIFTKHTGREFPQEPREQLDLAVRAVFDSWNAERAVVYRRQERIPADLGTAVNVVAMVFGNLGPDSGTGVAFTRDPASGAQGIYGDYLANAQGEDVVAGIRNTVPLQELERIDKDSYDELLDYMARLERHYRDLCDIEFTIERGKLWMLQTRVGKRTAAAAFVIAGQLVDEGLIDLDEALHRVNGAQLAQLMFPRFQLDHDFQPVAAGIGASPGAAVGKVVFTSARAVELAAEGEAVILVRRETNPDDLNGMIAARGILTSRGGKTSHAAVVARGMGKTCVSGADELDIDVPKRRFVVAGHTVTEGDVVSIDGTTGKVYLGEVPVSPSEVVRYFEGELDPASTDDALVKAVHRIMSHADASRRLAVRTNADTAADAAGPALRRRGHRAVPHRAHVPRRPSRAGGTTDPGPRPGRTGGGARRAVAVAAGRLRGDLPGDERSAGHRPADRPAAARVPAAAGTARRQRGGRPGTRRGRRQGGGAARGGTPDARGEPDARAARRTPGPGHPRPVRDAGPGDHRGGRGVHPPGRPRLPGDHGPAGRRGAGVGDGTRRGRADHRRGGRRQ